MLALDPERAVVLLSFDDVEPALPDPGLAAGGTQPHTFLSVLDLDIHKLDAAAIGEGLPVGLEVPLVDVPLAVEVLREDLRVLVDRPVLERRAGLSLHRA